MCASLADGDTFMEEGVIPAMAVHRVYERLHCVLDLIFYILYALHRRDVCVSFFVYLNIDAT